MVSFRLPGITSRSVNTSNAIIANIIRIQKIVWFIILKYYQVKILPGSLGSSGYGRLQPHFQKYIRIDSKYCSNSIVFRSVVEFSCINLILCRLSFLFFTTSFLFDHFKNFSFNSSCTWFLAFDLPSSSISGIISPIHSQSNSRKGHQ
jgi:uncharacterized membrane protein